MNSPVDSSLPHRVEDLIVIRLLAVGQKFSRRDLEKWLQEHVAEPVDLSAGVWRDVFEAALQSLHESGAIDGNALRLTEPGRDRAWQALGQQARTGTARWPAVYNRFLMAKVLGIRPQSAGEWDKLASVDGLRAAILVKHYRLPGKAVPTPKQALEALAWRQILVAHSVDIPTNKKFTRANFLNVLLLKGQAGDVEATLSARVAGARNTSPRALRIGLVAQWVHSRRNGPVSESRSPEPPVVQPPFDLPQFAQRIRHLAATATAGRYGDSKVYISHIWDVYRQECGSDGMSRDEFNTHLVEANRRELLTLSRADLIAAMDPRDVYASEIKTPIGDYHFVRTDQ